VGEVGPGQWFDASCEFAFTIGEVPRAFGDRYVVGFENAGSCADRVTQAANAVELRTGITILLPEDWLSEEATLLGSA
jgi:hypothetical protein